MPARSATVGAPAARQGAGRVRRRSGWQPLGAVALALASAACAAQDGDGAERRTWEAALGLIAQNRPEYPGAENRTTKLTPAIYLRYGRLTLTNASGFVNRRTEEVPRGVALDLVSSEHLRINLALRFDAGRSQTDSNALAGLGDIRPTVRARLNFSYQIAGPWRAVASLNTDALGRGGGAGGDLGLRWEARVAPDTALSAGVNLGFADGRYMQTYFGVTPAQAGRSVYPVYEPGAGLRDAGIGVDLRHDLGSHWAMVAGAGATRLLGPAARSPLTAKPAGVGVSLGVARRW